MTSIDYDAKGQRQAIVYGNNTRTDLTYDPDTHRLVDLKTTKDPAGTPVVVQHWMYTSDAAGNLVEIEDAASDVYFANNTVVGSDRAYTYDALYRLIEATGRAQDDHGTVYEGLPTANSASGSPPTFGVSSPGRYTQSFTYDAVGNLLSMKHVPTSASTWTRTYAYTANTNVSTQPTVVAPLNPPGDLVELAAMLAA